MHFVWWFIFYFTFLSDFRNPYQIPDRKPKKIQPLDILKNVCTCEIDSRILEMKVFE
jgi:hypothetical protein